MSARKGIAVHVCHMVAKGLSPVKNVTQGAIARGVRRAHLARTAQVCGINVRPGSKRLNYAVAASQPTQTTRSTRSAPQYTSG
jgi:hypothetical protein